MNVFFNAVSGCSHQLYVFYVCHVVQVVDMVSLVHDEFVFFLFVQVCVRSSRFLGLFGLYDPLTVSLGCS